MSATNKRDCDERLYVIVIRPLCIFMLLWFKWNERATRIIILCRYFAMKYSFYNSFSYFIKDICLKKVSFTFSWLKKNLCGKEKKVLLENWFPLIIQKWNKTRHNLLKVWRLSNQKMSLFQECGIICNTS